MHDRWAHVILCEDFITSITNKATIVGVYSNIILLKQSLQLFPQLVFHYMIETDANDPFQSIGASATLPDGQVLRFNIDLPVHPEPSEIAGLTRLKLVTSVLVQNLMISPGMLTAHVEHERGTIEAGKFLFRM